jgi:uncharacterized protein
MAKRGKKRSKDGDAQRARRTKGKASRPAARWRPASVVAAILITTAVALTAVLSAFAARDLASRRAPEGGAAAVLPTPTPTIPTRTSTPRRESPGMAQQAPRIAGNLVIVIDDVGYNMKELEPFLDLPFPLTIAVLPRLQYSEAAARAARKAGKDVILHQPMQAEGGQDPGPGALLLSMSREEALRVLEDNLLTVPGVVGINNHMGSAASADLYLMETVAELAKNRGIYYLDSLTVLGTAMPEAARREGIRYWERDVFLDNAPDRASIIRAVEDGKKRASKDRPAVMIGHVWSAELAQALADLYPKLVDEGYSLSTISRFMVQEAIGDDADPGD